MGQHVIAVDLGGTWMRAATVSPTGECGPIHRHSAGRERSPETIAADLLALLEVCRGASPAGSRPEAVSVGVPTVPDTRGCLTPSDNLPTMTGFPLRRHLEQAVGLPVALFKDANCFAVGEWWQGAGRGTRNCCGVTLGTGIGIGLVLDGKLHLGARGYAGEIWNTPWCDGTVEAQVCGRAIEAAYARRAAAPLAGDQIARLAAQGDALALDVYAAFGKELGRVLAFVINLVDPEVTVLGGSVADSFPFFRDRLMEVLASGASAGSEVRVEPSRLGERAALVGAAKLFWDGESQT